MSGWSWVFGTVVFVGVVMLIVVLIRISHQSSTSPPALPGVLSPLQILDRRLANGDLTAGEYRERLSALGLDS